MEYINLTITQLGEAAYKRSTMPDRGVWLTLLGYCVQQENGGHIPDANTWSDWDCQQVLGIPLADLQGTHHLWKFETGGLVVEFYPLDKQREVQAKRRAGRRGGVSSGQARSHPASSSPASSASSSPSTEGERKDKDKGKEGEAGDGQRPQSLDVVKAYSTANGISLAESEKFFDHFTANGWRQGGRTPLRSWQAALRNWARRSGDFTQKSSSGGAGPVDLTQPHAHTSGLEVFETGGQPAEVRA